MLKLASNCSKRSKTLSAPYKSGILALIVACAAATVAPKAHAENDDAAGAVLCLDGVIQGGSAGGSCGGYLAKYFSILPTHHGHLDFSAMVRERNDFTAQCSACPADTRQAISDRFGNKTGL